MDNLLAIQRLGNQTGKMKKCMEIYLDIQERNPRAELGQLGKKQLYK